MKYFLLIFLFTSLFSQERTRVKEPELLLLNKYNTDKNVSGWYMSEKLDGVRAYWDGKQLISRGGIIFAPPRFFIKDFPQTKLDGEFWSKRSDFSRISSIVNTHKPTNNWKHLTYNIFEVPNSSGNLMQRLAAVKESKYIKLIKQIKVKDKNHLEEFLKSVEQLGGEGIVVRDGSLDYYASRNNSALKVKSYQDEECKIISYTDGQGKYLGMIGSLVCEMQNKKLLKIGTGLSNKERKNPPKIGTIITFKYYGLTSKGNPRFPVYLRERKSF